MANPHQFTATAALRPPAPFWQVTSALSMIILIGVGLSFVLFSYTSNRINNAVTRQIEREVIQALGRVHGAVAVSQDIVRALRHVIRLSPTGNVTKLKDFTGTLKQSYIPSAAILMIQTSNGQDDRHVSLSETPPPNLPRRILDVESPFTPILNAVHGDEIVGGFGTYAGEEWFALVTRCDKGDQACFLVVLLPKGALLHDFENLVRSEVINSYALVEFDKAGSRAEQVVYRSTGHKTLPQAQTAQLRGHDFIPRGFNWTVSYSAQPDQESQYILLLPYLLIVIGILATGFSAIYVINTHDSHNELYTLTQALQHANEALEQRISAEAAMVQAVKLSEQKYRNIFENAGIGIAQIAPDRVWLAVNHRLVQMLGYHIVDEVLREQPDAQGRLYIDIAARQNFFNMLERHGHMETELAMRRRDGAKLWINLRGHAVRNHVGQTEYYECTMYDVTQRRLSEQALVRAKEQADFANRSKSEFLANMSHELRTPLNAIIGFSEIIKDQMLGAEGTPQYIEYAKDIHDSGSLLLSLINDILDMSKIEAGKRALAETSIDVDRVVQSSIRLVAVRAKAGGLTLTQHIPPDFPALRGEERALKQVLVNLLTNAIKFTPEGGHVMVKARIDSARHMAIAVQDTGIGIAPEDIPTALAPFGQIESVMSRKTQGTGLGLPLTKALIELHGGELLIESALGAGTTVTALFPAARVVSRNAG